MRMTQGSAHISDQAPENFDSLPAILLGDWSEARTSNGGTGELGSFSGFACWNLANPSEVGLFGDGSESST